MSDKYRKAVIADHIGYKTFFEQHGYSQSSNRGNLQYCA